MSAAAAPSSPHLDIRNLMWLLAAMAFVVAPHLVRMPYWVGIFFGGLVKESNAQGAIDVGVLPDRLPGHRTAGAADGLGEVWHTAPLADRGLGWPEIRGGGTGVRGLYLVGVDPLGGDPTPGPSPARGGEPE